VSFICACGKPKWGLANGTAKTVLPYSKKDSYAENKRVTNVPPIGERHERQHCGAKCPRE
jgi:hypothetical protein